MSCPIQYQFLHGPPDRLLKSFQVQPPVGKINQPGGQIHLDIFEIMLNMLKYHSVTNRQNIGTKRALKKLQNRMQEHKQ